MFIINTIIISIIIIATFKHPRKTWKGVIYHVYVSCYSLPVNQTGLAPNWQNDTVLSPVSVWVYKLLCDFGI